MAGEWDSTSRRESRVPVGGWSSAILRKNINIFQNSHQNSHSREKKKTAF
jgi:hypothetical protein